MNPLLIDITSKVLGFLAPRDIVRLERASYATLTACKDSVIDRDVWKKLLKERFGGSFEFI